MVTQRQRCWFARASEQGLHFGFTQDFGKALPNFRGIDIRERVVCQHSLLLKKEKKSPKSGQTSCIGACTDVAGVAKTKIELNIPASDCGDWLCILAKKGVQICFVRLHGVDGEAAGKGEVLQKTVQQVKRLVDSRALKLKKNPGRKTGASVSTAIFHPVELAKFTQGFRSFTAFLHAGFLVVFAPFQLTFDTIDLQFFLQLPDRVFKVTSDIYFDHIASLPLVVGLISHF